MSDEIICVGSKRELEGTVLLESYDLIVVTETCRD